MKADRRLAQALAKRDRLRAQLAAAEDELRQAKIDYIDAHRIKAPVPSEGVLRHLLAAAA